MTRHHQGALAMAEEEAKDGKNQDAVDLAEAITSAHPDVIAAMQALRR